MYYTCHLQIAFKRGVDKQKEGGGDRGRGKRVIKNDVN